MYTPNRTVEMLRAMNHLVKIFPLPLSPHQEEPCYPRVQRPLWAH